MSANVTLEPRVIHSMSRGPGRPPKNPNTPPGGRSNVSLNARIEPAILERFLAFAERYNQVVLKSEKSAHVEKAITQYLDREEAKLDAIDKRATGHGKTY